MYTKKQRGGIVSFVAVGVVLAGLLAGALYFSKQQGREARNDTPVPEVVERDATREESSEGTPPAEENNDSPAPQTNGAGQGSTPTPAPSPEGSADNGANQPPGSTDRVATTGPSDLPATGPAEAAAIIIGLAGLTFALSRHASARRHLRQSALRK